MDVAPPWRLLLLLLLGAASAVSEAGHGLEGSQVCKTLAFEGAPAAYAGTFTREARSLADHAVYVGAGLAGKKPNYIFFHQPSGRPGFWLVRTA